jgi:hypothetical protein
MRNTASSILNTIGHVVKGGDLSQCATCLLELRNYVHDLVYCDMTPRCSCSVCVMQLPTLLEAASHVLFRLVFDLERFELTADTTYWKYVFVVNSNRVDTLNLLPPEFPFLQIIYFQWWRSPISQPSTLPSCPTNAPWFAHDLRLRDYWRSHSSIGTQWEYVLVSLLWNTRFICPTAENTHLTSTITYADYYSPF